MRKVTDMSRPKCKIEGCNNVCRKRSKKRANGSINTWITTTCAKHRSDGTIRPSHTKQSKAASNLKHAFGLTLKDYQQMYDSQGGRCKICGRHESEFKRKLAVDHNHTTGQIRALLCGHCNCLVGSVESESDLIKKCEAYLKFYEPLAVLCDTKQAKFIQTGKRNGWIKGVTK